MILPSICLTVYIRTVWYGIYEMRGMAIGNVCWSLKEVKEKKTSVAADYFVVFV